MIVRIELSESDLKQLVLRHVREKTGQEITLANINIETRSKHNYRSEWETAQFRATYVREI